MQAELHLLENPKTHAVFNKIVTKQIQDQILMWFVKTENL